MKIYILYRDNFILIVDKVISYLADSVLAKIIDVEHLMNEESSRVNASLNSNDIYKDDFINVEEILQRQLNVQNILLINFPGLHHDIKFILPNLMEKNALVLEKIWYLRSFNVIKNLKNNKKYLNPALNANSSLSHIIENDIDIKIKYSRNIQLIGRLDITEIIDLPAFSYEDLIPYLEFREEH